VWNDDSERMHGKTASSWVVLARKPEHLGDRLCSPIGELIGKYGADEQVFEALKHTYPELQALLEKTQPKLPDLKNLKDPKELEKLKEQKEPERDQKKLVLEWLDKRTGDELAEQCAKGIRLRNSEYSTLMEILKEATGYGFRPVRKLKYVDAWTDDYADVMRVMTIEQLQSVRKLFGLPTPVER
jgi:hypothetical protein